MKMNNTENTNPLKVNQSCVTVKTNNSFDESISRISVLREDKTQQTHIALVHYKNEMVKVTKILVVETQFYKYLLLM
jgi:hypothetical protein